MRNFPDAFDVAIRNKLKSLTIALVITGANCFAAEAIGAYNSDSNFNVLDLVVVQSGFKNICEVLELSREQKQEANQFFEVYRSAVRRLDVDAKQRVDAAGSARARELEDEARYAGLERPRDEIAVLMNQSRGEYVKAQKESDALLLKFYEQLQVILLPTQEENFERIPRLVRRLNWQHRKKNAVKNDFISINLFTLVEKAKAEGGELEPIFVTSPDEEQEQKLKDFRIEIQAALLRYELEFDTILLEGLARARKMRYSATNSEDREAKWKRTAQKLSRQWDRYYSFTDRAVAQITDIAERAVGENAKQSWIKRYNAEFCPDLYAERWPERMTDWLLERPDFTAEQLELSAILLDEYLVERKRLRRAAISAGVRAMQKHLSTGGIEPLQIKYAQRLLDLHKLNDRISSRFHSLLTKEQRVSLTSAIKSARISQPSILGPWVDSAAREKITKEIVPEGVLILIDPRTGKRIPNIDPRTGKRIPDKKQETLNEGTK